MNMQHRINLGDLIDQIVVGISLLGEKEIEGVQIFFANDDLIIYNSKNNDGKFTVLLNGKSIQRDN